MGASHIRLINMGAPALVLLALASVHGDSDPYTIGQVAYGATYGGVVTGVDYGYGHVAGLGAIGNRPFYGKREADSDAYTIGQVAYGLPVHNAYATGHPHNVGVVTGVGYGYGHLGYYGKREAEPYTIGQVAYGLPVHNAVATGHAHNVGVVTGYGYGLGYAGYAGHFYG